MVSIHTEATDIKDSLGMTTPSPEISLILTVKNGMPYVQAALESVAQQSVRGFEVVVQDSMSNDGTSEIFDRYCVDPRLEGVLQYRREADLSLSEAKARALKRCRGAIIGSLDADNLLTRDSVKIASQYFRENPNLAALYGAQHMISADGTFKSKFFPEAFDLDRVIECSIVPPFGSAYFRKSLVGDLILPSPDLLYCADFELWLNISHLEIRSVPEILACTRISTQSITCRPETYEQSCRDKLTALDRFFARYPEDALHHAVKMRAQAGVFVWAAESVAFSFPSTEGATYVLRFLRCAEMLCPTSIRLQQLKSKLGLPPREQIGVQ